jgi:hypothetical protein
MWLNDLKIAIIEKNTQKIETLIDEMPIFETLENMQEASYLLREASILLHTLKDETAKSMQQIKKNLNFLRSTESSAKNTFDIKS